MPELPQATPVPDVMIPWAFAPDPDGHVWAMFHYDDYPADPWNWPKLLVIDDKPFIYRGHDSDLRNVCYSEKRATDQVAWIQDPLSVALDATDGDLAL
jgi:hypothetical protein